MSRSKVIINPDVIIDEAFDLIRTRGLDSFSVRKLASRLNVSSMTLYNYVANMEEVKGQVIARVVEGLRHDIADVVDGLAPETREFMIRMGMAVYRFARANTGSTNWLFFQPTGMNISTLPIWDWETELIPRSSIFFRPSFMAFFRRILSPTRLVKKGSSHPTYIWPLTGSSPTCPDPVRSTS